MPAPIRTAALKAAIAITFALAASGCSTTVIDGIPAWAGGEPANTPARRATALEYPAVNERPPARDTRVVTADEQERIERELAAARDIQAKQAAQVRKDRANMIANQPKPTTGQTSQ